MRSLKRPLKTLGIVAFAAAMTGCVPDWARENETGFLMAIEEIEGIAGGGTPESILLSDVDPDFNDDAIVTVGLFRKNPTVSETTPLESVRLETYQVRYFRSDGHNVEGVDVPHRITGPLNSVILLPASGPDRSVVEVAITIVRHQAKHEPPLANLVGIVLSPTPGGDAPGLLFPGPGIITTVAEITVFARQVTTGEPLSATGRLQVTFADFADTAQ